MPEKVNGNKFSGKSNIASLNSGNSPIASKSAVQLSSSEQKLATIQKIADNSPYSQRFAQLKSLANKNINPKQPVSQLSKDSHSLPDNVKQGVESLSGISMDDVKVHYNSAKPAQLNAHAYAQGTDIHIASGQEKHLPHEAWHVVQQKQGRVRPTTMMKAKVPINDDQGLEKEADVMGARALQMKPFSLSDYKMENSSPKEGVVQKVPKKKKTRDERLWDIQADKLANKKKKEEEEEEEEKEEKEVEVEEKEGDEDIFFHSLSLTKIKFNFAGSGQDTWQTRKTKYDESGKNNKDFKKAEHDSGGKKMVKEKNYLNGKSMVVEYSGPCENFLLGAGKGASDSGPNSTENNLKDAQLTLTKLITELQDSLVGQENAGNFKIDLDIKGFSRGAATASTFAVWAKSQWGKNLDINLLLIDPVDGYSFSSKMESEVDVSTVYDDEKPDTTGTTLMMPVKAKGLKAFSPQTIKGYQRLIIIYGSKAEHNSALAGEKPGETKNTLTWKGKLIKGMDITRKLNKGLYVVNSEFQPLEIVKVPNMKFWEDHLEKEILGQVSVVEDRDLIIKRAIEVELEKYL